MDLDPSPLAIRHIGDFPGCDTWLEANRERVDPDQVVAGREFSLTLDRTVLEQRQARGESFDDFFEWAFVTYPATRDQGTPIDEWDE